MHYLPVRFCCFLESSPHFGFSIPIFVHARRSRLTPRFAAIVSIHAAWRHCRACILGQFLAGKTCTPHRHGRRLPIGESSRRHTRLASDPWRVFAFMQFRVIGHYAQLVRDRPSTRAPAGRHPGLACRCRPQIRAPLPRALECVRWFCGEIRLQMRMHLIGLREDSVCGAELVTGL